MIAKEIKKPECAFANPMNKLGKEFSCLAASDSRCRFKVEGHASRFDMAFCVKPLQDEGIRKGEKEGWGK